MKNGITRKRLVYGIIALVIFLSEVYIALFVSDNFIRPYFGDVLVTALICCFIRIFLPVSENYSVKRKSVYLLPVFVFIFSVCVEIGQYFHYVDLMGLGHIQFFRVVMGMGFAFEDILCYLAGCIAFFLIECAIRTRKNKN
ncbi:MAG: DUF2809 domain-containing protein [Ruminococcaceae bacterium]|nr:DUF2809 domain-containing protein [Oscillospiraceae bacterium]